MTDERGGVLAWVLAFVVFAGVGMAALVGISCAVGAGCPFDGDLEITTTDGEELYIRLCARCHGPEGGGGDGPSLVSGSAAEMDLQALQHRIAEGRRIAGMPAFAEGPYNLTDEQIRSVARYVLTLREAP